MKWSRCWPRAIPAPSPKCREVKVNNREIENETENDASRRAALGSLWLHVDGNGSRGERAGSSGRNANDHFRRWVFLGHSIGVRAHQGCHERRVGLCRRVGGKAV